eukprot:657570-Prorocentrum_minimum.AAC.1
MCGPLPTPSRPPPDPLQTPSRPPPDPLQTPSRPLPDPHVCPHLQTGSVPAGRRAEYIQFAKEIVFSAMPMYPGQEDYYASMVRADWPSSPNWLPVLALVALLAASVGPRRPIGCQ